ncbi:MAG: cell division protein FtsZ [Candidatus Nealsonbacteria bacterium]|nr:cell division protein FtsZ [Candidatus Nealsonbacteria bacterium]
MAHKSKKIIKKEPVVSVKPEEVKKVKIRVVGIGGGGGNIVSEIANRVKGASFVAANTDSQALRHINKKVISLQFGESFTHGLGTGTNPEIAALAAEADKEKIKKIFQDQDLVILIATLGSGTGSGASPYFAKVSRGLGNLTLGIFTLPFKFEGAKKIEIAREALDNLKSKVNAFVVVPNERIFQLVDKTTPLSSAFSEINKILAKALEGLIEIIFQPGLINIDFADLRTILSGTGKLAFLNTVEIQRSEGATKEAVEKTVNSPLFPYNVKGAKGALFNIAGEKDLELSEVNQISETIFNLTNTEAKIIFGVLQDKKYKGVIKTTLLAVGCQMRDFFGDLPRPKAKRKIKIKAEKKKNNPDTKGSGLRPKRRRNKKKIRRASPPSPRLRRVKQKKLPLVIPVATEGKQEIRKNAIQVKQEAEEEEAKILAEEQAWQTPAFLRRKVD